MANVLKFQRNKTPDDLLSFKQFILKHKMSSSFLYKFCDTYNIQRYKRGVWKISESEVLRALNGVT